MIFGMEPILIVLLAVPPTCCQQFQSPNCSRSEGIISECLKLVLFPYIWLVCAVLDPAVSLILVQ